MTRKLPATLADIDQDWRVTFRCLTCNWSVEPAFYYLKRDHGDVRFADLLRKIYCKRCRAAGRSEECSIVIYPTYWYTPNRPDGAKRYEIRRGRSWEPYEGP